MPITVNQKQLSAAIKAANKVLPKKPHLPILAGLHFHFSQHSLTIATSDFTSGLQLSLPATGDTDASFTVLGKTLTDAVNFFTTEDSVFTLDSKELVLTNGRDRVRFPLLTDDFPEFAVPSLTKQNASLVFWQNVVAKTTFASSHDESRPALTGIYLQPADSVTNIVCTDGFRLAVWQNSQSILNLEKPLIISAKAVIDAVSLAELFELSDLSFAFDSVGEQIFFTSTSFTYYSKIINANYPPFEKIIPLDFKTQLVLDREDLASNLTKASVFTRADTNTVKLSITDDALEFFAATTGEGNFNSSQDYLQKTGDNLDISFNISYLQDFLKYLKDNEVDQVWLGCNEPNSPTLFQNPADPTLRYIVMPFKLKG